jgi:hypothetical protein
MGLLRYSFCLCLFLLMACPKPPPAVCGNGVTEAPEACDDANPFFDDGCNPDCTLIPEDCDDGRDNDGDNDDDCFDSDCAAAPNCQAELTCDDDEDNDGDGSTDCDDSDCAAAINCIPETNCQDQQDNDVDGAIDCFDDDCIGNPDCKALGEPCENDFECSGRFCINEADFLFPGGYCTNICSGGACDPGSKCFNLVAIGPNTCLETCQTSADCRAGYDCFGDGGGGFACFPDCNDDAECPSTGRCETLNGLCADTDENCNNNVDDDDDALIDCLDFDCASAANCQELSPNNVTQINLGVVTLGQDVNFTIPANTEGFMIHVDGAPGVTYSVERLVRPDALVVLSNRFDTTNITTFPDIDTHSLIMPQNDKASNVILPGSWQLRIFGSATSNPTVTIFLRPTPFIGGTIDLKLYIPTGLTACRDNFCTANQIVTPQNANTFDEIQGMLNTFFEEFYSDEGGFSPGNVEFFSVSSGFLTVSNDAEYDALVANSSLGGNGGLHLFLIQNFDGQIGANVAGRASGIPGAIGLAGSPNAGVVVTMVGDPRLSGNITGFVAAHEVGHFLGLFHTTEFSGTPDQIADTPSCSFATINNTPEACPDAAFMMFPSALPSAINISNTQKKPLRAGPLY